MCAIEQKKTSDEITESRRSGEEWRRLVEFS